MFNYKKMLNVKMLKNTVIGTHKYSYCHQAVQLLAPTGIM
jgi:hypothetical protein